MNQNPDYLYWEAEGKNCWTLKPELKIDLLRQYGKKYGCKIFIETGTAEGDTIAGLQNDFDNLYSMETQEEFFNRAHKRFLGNPGVWIFLGPSVDILDTIFVNLNLVKPILFWLDAHWNNESPLEQELELIFKYQDSGVILIDDLQGFWDNDWPEVAARVVDAHPGWVRETKDGIMRVVKAS